MSYVSCQYCGSLHKRGEVCQSKQANNYKKDTSVNRFRNSHRWRMKSKSIMKRDNYLCQCCIRNMEGTMRQYEFDNLSVHHIIPVAVDESKKLDDDYLITLCRFHHEEAEKGNISIDTLLNIVKEQNSK